MRIASRPLLVVLLLCPVWAWADGFQSPESIRDAAIASLGPGVQAEVRVDPRTRMPACAQALQAAANGPASVAVRCADNPGWQLYVPVRRADGEPLAQAAAPARAGLRPLSGRRLKPVGFTPEPEAPPLVQRGDPVTLVSRVGGMEVRMAGRAMGAAAVGATVSVENTGSRRIIRGRLVGPGVVEVQL
ncbi:flagellar basal body P-ring formation chaperone FlgA [Lysobacter sp. LF1]|uniref:Flagella basal body P-ring formation protein FlgA n=1 Tax=Lysobacter stagni TaxID=3045172 RepID=A0ABT6XBE1_9GAMM|nr:flagellar basal body P-ring formation chaperone FlgA [Lysobacter sp. LF1]MDI9237406.1 flagellar basal body P-ring formation chaperone FlgA [Lysobacter sp. LF1]